MRILRQVPQGLPDECGAGSAVRLAHQPYRMYPLHEVRGKLPERGAGADDEITRRGLTDGVLHQRAAMPDADDKKLGCIPILTKSVNDRNKTSRIVVFERSQKSKSHHAYTRLMNWEYYDKI